MMEKGEGHEYRGKTLDEININVNELVSDEQDSDENESDKCMDQQSTSTQVTTHAPVSMTTQKQPKEELSVTEKKASNNKNLKVVNSKKKVIIPWLNEEKSVTKQYFKKHILLGKAPRKQECEELLKLHPQVKKPWKKIKDFIHNTINAEKKK